MSSKFETVATTLNALTFNKKPSCVEALTSGFNVALDKGLSNREAYYYAEITHFLNDHDGANNGPTLDIPETDDAVRQYIVEVLMEKDNDGKAEDRIDVVIKWYDLALTWGAPIALAFTTAAQAGQEEWEDANDLDEAEALTQLDTLPVDDEESELLKNKTITRFYALRNAGENVRNSLRTAINEARQEIEMKVFLEMLSAGLGGGQRGGGFVN